MENELKRLNKFIGETGYCSRREADAIIEAGRVTVNGNVAELGMKVSGADEIRIDGKLIVEKTGDFVYLALNKPPGIECTTNLDVKENIVDYVNFPRRIFPIGRLDKASEGLIFLTDDGEIVNKILRARNNHEKEYEVVVDQPVSDRFIEKMSKGVPILDTVTRECFVEKTGKDSFRIILTQGLNRQIRRMCEYLGYEVVKLKRTRIINITLDLPVGRHRELTKEEVDQLQLLIAPSSKTEDASFAKNEFGERPKEFQKRDFQRRDSSDRNSAGRNASDKPKRDFEKRDFRRDDSDTNRSNSDAPKRDFQKRDFKRDDSDRSSRNSDAPKRDFEKRDFRRDESDTNRSNSDAPKRDFQKRDFKRDDSDRSSRNSDAPKRDFEKRDFRRDDSDRSSRNSDAPKRDFNRNDDAQRPDSFKPGPKRSIEIIKKDDPRYRKEGDS
ncbi:MAG: pseudouridine synthase [Flavobacterium sp.]|nr:MAG: pseudouridine synthase [Flavobacterium sp.]